MIAQLGWLLFVTIVFAGLCILFTILGKKASSALALQYEKWRNRRSTVKHYPKEHSKYGIRHYSERGVVEGVTNRLKDYEDKDSYEESNKQAHEPSLTGTEHPSQSQHARR